MMLVPTYLSNSAIHGIGIYAAEPILKGTVIWRFMDGLDVVLDEALLTTAEEPIRSYLNRYCYPHHSIPGKIILDGDNGRFMNHSDTPNTDFTHRDAKTTHAFNGYALHDIPRGEEITTNYNEFAPGFVLD